MLVVPASSSLVALDVSAPGWGDKRGTLVEVRAQGVVVVTTFPQWWHLRMDIWRWWTSY